tara:strand:- start:174 stop:392 length:219 start_codon:yes stop_codon:yes gene_type:complete
LLHKLKKEGFLFIAKGLVVVRDDKPVGFGEALLRTSRCQKDSEGRGVATFDAKANGGIVNLGYPGSPEFSPR